MKDMMQTPLTILSASALVLALGCARAPQVAPADTILTNGARLHDGVG